MNRIAKWAVLSLLLVSTRSVLAAQAPSQTPDANVAQALQPVPPPSRANQAASFKGFSTWDIQGLYGTEFREPGTGDIPKWTATLENSSAWSWGSSYFFLDYLRSNSSADSSATEFYGEWYPSVSVTRVTGKSRRLPFLNDVLLTMGFNAGTNSTGASPFVLLPGITFDIKIPWFQFLSVGAYAYIDRGRVSGLSNGCNTSTYQVTPSWSLPFSIGAARFRFDGFVDFIGAHGQCANQIVSQPTVKLDLGNFRGVPDKVFAGVEWSYWKNKYGISGLNQTAPQAVVMWVL